MISTFPVPPLGWHLSTHASRRALERGLCDRELQLAIEQPDSTYPQTSSYGSDRRVHVRGEWAVVLNPTERTVITVLFHDPRRAAA